jgi:hypothetical protein
MVSAAQVRHRQSAAYAGPKDFCRIFAQDMDHLYLLSFLLTADRATAEKCFVAGLADSASSPRVFKEWADSWARRMIIQNAINITRPNAGDHVLKGSADWEMEVPAGLSGIVELSALERFVFVMSVLERYSDHDCALLLGSTRRDVIAARLRALQQLGNSANVSRDGIAGLAPKLEPASSVVRSA